MQRITTFRRKAGTPPELALDTGRRAAYPEFRVQLSFNKKPCQTPDAAESLAHLRRGEEAVLASIELPEELSQRLMELGFLPGTRVVASESAPGGDPRVFRVDGSEVALRLELARKVSILPRRGPA